MEHPMEGKDPPFNGIYSDLMGFYSDSMEFNGTIRIYPLVN